MIKAQILIEMIDGQLYTYVNSHLADKDEKDAKGNYIFKGEPGKYYMYTGEEGDEYDDQDSAGMAKADYEALLADVATPSGYVHSLMALMNYLFQETKRLTIPMLLQEKSSLETK